MIHGKLIDLVPLNSSHSEFMISMLNDQEIAYLEGRTEPMISIEKQENWYRNNLNSPHQYFIMQTKDDAKPVGYMSLKITNQVSRNALLAAKIIPEAQKKGYGVDSMKTMSGHSFFTFNIHRLYTYVLEYNIGSQRLTARLGWRTEGVEKKSTFVRGKFHDRLIYAILREEFVENEKDPFYNPFAS